MPVRHYMKYIVAGLMQLVCMPYSLADCQVSLSQHDVNYGQIKPDDIVNTVKQWNALAQRDVHLTALCTEPQKMALFFSGKSGEQGAFIFGDRSGLFIQATQATLDGKNVSLSHTVSHDPFVIAGQSGDEHLVQAQQGLIPVQGSQILAGKQFSVTLTLKPVLNKNELHVRDKHDVMSDIQINVETE